MSFQRILATTIQMPVAGLLKATGMVQMGTSGASPWRYSFNLFIDGVLVWYPGGVNPQDSIPLGGVVYCQAGARYAELLWTADPGLTIYNAWMLLEAINKTGG